ncbi:MAG: pantetheine-phosphate adenylyltransferase [Bdellovibrionota bacterium]
MSKTRIVYPGSFDPITLGHLDIIERLSEKFDEVVVLISSSTQKKYIFNFKERKDLVGKACKNFENVTVDSSDGLLVDYLKKNKITMLAKGLRNGRDFEYEITMDHTNKTLYPEIETIYLVSRPEYSFISSTLVKEIAMLKGDLKKFVPDIVLKALSKRNS